MSNRPLTDHLRSLSTPAPYTDAINHPFLQSAGDGTLNHDLLALWLAQDRIYAAHAYPRFIGALIAAIPFSKEDGIDSPTEALKQRILKVLTYSLENIVREVDFFSETAKRWHLDLEGWRERKGTRDYVAEMGSIVRGGRMEDGLVFLWAMEQTYLDAWTFVREKRVTRAADLSPDNSSPLTTFANNWTCSEFMKFVDDLADLVNTLSIDRARAEEIWARTIELEKEFWPSVGEEISMRVSL
ncbi:heme oxygenase-like protein [Mycena sp. CBHHK59/15]|nr:heme oxygenase-like protein [Mycena sp. CBHHK59/15]